MVNFVVSDEVGWPESGLDIYGTVTSDPNEMGEFYVLLQDELGNTHTRTLDENYLPEGFINYTASMVKPGAGAEAGAESSVVITKPQEQSMWPYMAFLVVGGALILNM